MRRTDAVARLKLVKLGLMILGCGSVHPVTSNPVSHDLVSASSELIRSTWLNDMGGYENYYSDGTMTIDQLSGHETWQVEGDVLVMSIDGGHRFKMEWQDENHLTLDSSEEYTTDPTYPDTRHIAKSRWVKKLVRCCKQTQHGNQYY